MARVDSYNKNIKSSLSILLLYGFILGYDLFTVIFHRLKLSETMSKESAKYEVFSTIKKFNFFYFTVWNFALQIIFLLLAVADEISKLANISRIQSRIEKIRLSIFSTLVFPSSLLVVSIFWGVWHIDRELIFPKIIDQFYPNWINHSLHTFIIIPLIIEVISKFKNNNLIVSKKRAATILIVYCALYQGIYLSIYFLHGVWIYPIYKILTWAQRAAFTIGQLILAISFQQIGLLLLSPKTSKPKIN